MAEDTFFITTPIYYVNGEPHLGHGYTTVAADAIARWQRLRGKKVLFLTGTDEHGQKVYQTALARGVSPQAHCDELSVPFRELFDRLMCSHDDFIRTTEPRHIKVVQRILQTLYDQGDIYKDSYDGWYSTSAERFWTEEELVDGKCPDTGLEVEWLAEENFYFRMSKYADRFRQWIEDHPNFLRPEARRNEVLGLLRKEVGDLCITRPVTRLPWGIPIPWDENFVTYVWFDALINYISAPGYRSGDPALEDRFQAHWPADYHLVGKDILTTHSLYWSTMLFAMGLEPADCLYAHGWLTSGGRKMSKSYGNVIDPNLLVDAFGVDATRYYFLREIAFGADGDFSYEGFLVRYNAELANDLGNLAHRTLSMTRKWLGGTVPALGALTEEDQALFALAADVVARFDEACTTLRFKDALGACMELAAAGNKYVDTQEPWTLNRTGDKARLGTVMRLVLELCRVAGTLLTPVCPVKGPELLSRLGTELPELSGDGLASLARLDQLTEGLALELGEPLFPRLTELPAIVVEAMAAQAATTNQDAPEPEPKPAKETPKMETKDPISFDDFSKLELKTGQVQTAEKHPNADRLLVMTVDVGEESPRTIVAGIAGRFEPTELVGRTVIVVTNLKPAKLRGVVSEGMILAAGGKDVVDLATIPTDVSPGTVVR